MSFATFIRTLALSLNVAVISMTVFVFYAYWVAFKKARQTDNPYTGLLPFHVMAVSIYAIIKSAVGVVTILEFQKSDVPLNVVGPMHLVADLILVVGLVLILLYQRRRVRLTTVDALDALAEECEPTELYRGKTP